MCPQKQASEGRVLLQLGPHLPSLSRCFFGPAKPSSLLPAGSRGWQGSRCRASTFSHPNPPPAPCGFSCCLQGGLAGSCPRQSSAPAGLARAGGCVSCGLAWENTRPECSRGWKAPGAWPGCLCSRGAARVPQPHSAPPWVESLWQISPGQFGVEARRGVHSPGPATMDRFQGPSPGGSPHLCWC